MQLTKLLDINWENQACTFIFLTKVITNKREIDADIPVISKKNPLKILIVKLISKANVEDKAQFVFSA